MFATTFQNTRHLKRHYNLDFLESYYGDDVSAMMEVLKLYLQETPKELEKIESSLLDHNPTEAKAITHKIKTNITMLGIVDPTNFINTMRLHDPDVDGEEEIITLFKSFKLEVLKGMKEIEMDFFSMK